MYLNRQAILLLSFRKIPDVIFLELQQRNHLTLIRYLLRNADAEKLILDKIPQWLLPRDIRVAGIDYIHEPFFRQILINLCLQSMRDLLRKTRIHIPINKGRNMFGIVDEYRVLKEGEVFVQYTQLRDDQTCDEDDVNDDRNKRTTTILKDCQVVMTKNPCHHPGDIRTFIARDYPALRHLKDVVVFSQQGERPAPHDISGSDLDGDEYIVIWHEDLVPLTTDNAPPFDYDAKQRPKTPPKVITRAIINEIVLDIAELDCIGSLSNLHSAYADQFGVDSTHIPRGGTLSTIGIAAAISQEVDSAKTGYHPVNSEGIQKLNKALGDQRPDYVDNTGYTSYESPRILGKCVKTPSIVFLSMSDVGQLYRASRGTLPAWNRLVRYHRHLRHLQIRTSGDLEEDDDDDDATQDDDRNTAICVDPSFLHGFNRDHPLFPELASFAKQLVYVYRQEMLEILSLYGISHESDVWCRNSINAASGELEDTAFNQLEKLAHRTRSRVFYSLVSYCETGQCNMDTPFSNLCNTCNKIQRCVAVAVYCLCYDASNIAPHSAPILSLPWIFVSPLLQGRLEHGIPPPPEPQLISAMKKAADFLYKTGRFRMLDSKLVFKQPNTTKVIEANAKVELALFIEIVRQWMYKKQKPVLLQVLSRFARLSLSADESAKLGARGDEWLLDFSARKIPSNNQYGSILNSVQSTEETDKEMHQYFDDLLDICFQEGRKKDNCDYLTVGENMILLLQKLAIDGTLS